MLKWETKTPRRGVSSLIPARVVLGHLRGALHIVVQRVTLYQPGPANLYTFYAAFSHHASYMFNMVLELFGSFFSGYKIIQIWYGSFHYLIEAEEIYKSLELKTFYRKVPPRRFELRF
jgi:hypothetical protein